MKSNGDKGLPCFSPFFVENHLPIMPLMWITIEENLKMSDNQVMNFVPNPLFTSRSKRNFHETLLQQTLRYRCCYIAVPMTTGHSKASRHAATSWWFGSKGRQQTSWDSGDLALSSIKFLRMSVNPESVSCDTPVRRTIVPVQCANRSVMLRK